VAGTEEDAEEADPASEAELMRLVQQQAATDEAEEEEAAAAEAAEEDDDDSFVASIASSSTEENSTSLSPTLGVSVTASVEVRTLAARAAAAAAEVLPLYDLSLARVARRRSWPGWRMGL